MRARGPVALALLAVLAAACSQGGDPGVPRSIGPHDRGGPTEAGDRGGERDRATEADDPVAGARDADGRRQDATDVEAPLHSIGGRVTDTAGRPLDGVNVEIYDGTYYGQARFEEETKTAADGTYIFLDREPGLYRFRVRFVDPAGVYSPQWYDGVPSTADPQASFEKATEVSVSFEGAATGIDAALIRGAGLSGTITSAASGGTVGGRNGVVEIYDPDRTLVLRHRARDGRWSVPGLAPGRYKVRFSSADGELAYAWYPNVGRFDEAETISLGEGARRTLDVALGTGGWIEGTIGVDDACAWAYAAKGDVAGYAANEGGQNRLVGEDEEPRYRIGGLRPGKYRIKFDDCNEASGHYAPRWYNGKNNFAGADPVEVANGRVTSGIDGSPRTQQGGGGGGGGN